MRSPVALTLGPDSIVGPYRLLRELGQGGTSSVWLAERVDGSIKRSVALKLPHLGLVDRGIEQRIARETEILGVARASATSRASTTPASTSAAGPISRSNTSTACRRMNTAAPSG